MFPQGSHSIGGQIMAKRQRDEAIQKYYLNPNVCLTCSNIIPIPENVKVSDIRKKKFCNKSCAAKHTNRNRVLTKPCQCGSIIPKRRRKCFTCLDKRRIHLKTKGEVFRDRKNWQSARSGIRRDACFVFERSGLKKECLICKYDKHVEICHRTAVKDFPDDTLIQVINDKKNLVALCPNHHWEFDNGFLKLSE